jgi:hypothetical protein
MSACRRHYPGRIDETDSLITPSSTSALRTLDQTRSDALFHDVLKQLLKQIRLLKAAMPVLRERRVMGNLLLES